MRILLINDTPSKEVVRVSVVRGWLWFPSLDAQRHCLDGGPCPPSLFDALPDESENPGCEPGPSNSTDTHEHDITPVN